VSATCEAQIMQMQVSHSCYFFEEQVGRRS